MVVSPDKKEAIVGFYQSLNKVNGSWLRLRLKGLAPEKLYNVTVDLSSTNELDPIMTIIYGVRADSMKEMTFQAYGDELMNAGLVINRLWLDIKGGDFSSLIYTLKEAE